MSSSTIISHSNGGGGGGDGGGDGGGWLNPIGRETTITRSSSSNSNKGALKVYESIIFSGPIVLTLIIVFLFYFFYLRRHSVDWSSLRMRVSRSESSLSAATGVSEVGLKKEFREMLPIIVFKESFSVKDSLCSVCLGDYQAEDRLQQIPACGHTFHQNCIDHWLATHTTCPLCRVSLIGSSKNLPASPPDTPIQTASRLDTVDNFDDILLHNRLQVL